ncbi:hypothetical protein Hanom_Chr13g01220241 [Helianthus anomalus]
MLRNLLLCCFLLVSTQVTRKNQPIPIVSLFSFSFHLGFQSRPTSQNLDW